MTLTDVNTIFKEEFNFLNDYESNSISISTTSKEATLFNVLPRREYLHTAMSSFMINDVKLLEQTLCFFDGKVETIYIDIEQKQEINLYKIAKEIVTASTLLTVKPNDITLESTDLFIRNHFWDDLLNKDVIVVGTGNLASKIAVRLAERQANVYIKGRTESKERKIVDALNLFLPSYTKRVRTFEELADKNVSLIISFLSGPFLEEDILHPFIDDKTLVLDAGINNFSQTFIKKVLQDKVDICRLDTRIALPYQFLFTNKYVQTFFSDVLGTIVKNGVTIASGGFIGPEGTVIVNNIKSPNQIIGIADGSGGIKADEQLNARDRERIQAIKETIS